MPVNNILYSLPSNYLKDLTRVQRIFNSLQLVAFLKILKKKHIFFVEKQTIPYMTAPSHEGGALSVLNLITL